MIKNIVVGELETNSYLFSPNGTDCCILDPGAEGAMIAQAAESAGLIPRAVIFTHGHLDHLLGAAELVSALARRGIACPLYIHELELAYTGPGCLETHTRMLTAIDPRMISLYSAEISQIPLAEHTLTDGDIISGFGLEVLHTKGHSPGSICLYHRELGILFSGDTLFHGSAGRTDLPGGNGKQLKISLAKLVTRIPDSVKVYPGHGPSTTMQQEKTINPFL